MGTKKVALVTGASKGVGKGAAEGLASIRSNLQSTLPNKIRFTNAFYRARSHHQVKFLPQGFHDLTLILLRGY